MKGIEDNENLGFLPERFDGKFEQDLNDLCRVNNYEHSNIISILQANGIKTTVDISCLDLPDLVVITGMTRYQLYDFVSTLRCWRVYLGQSSEQMKEAYYYWRRKKQQNDAIYKRLEQLQADGKADAETIVLKEMRDGKIPVSKKSEKEFDEDYCNFTKHEYENRERCKKIVRTISYEVDTYLRRKEFERR